MTALTDEHIDILFQYKELLDSIDEGFEYIVASFSDYSKTESDVILSDIFNAFTQVIQVNEELQFLLQKDAQFLLAIQGFEQVILAAEEMNGLFEKSQEKQEVVQKSLVPAYKEWVEKIPPLLIEKTRQ